MEMRYNLKTQEGRAQYIRDTWTGTAGLAYAGYRGHDRGGVVFAPGHDYPLFVPRLTDFGYSNFPNPSVEQIVNTYDPENEIVVIFFLLDSTVVFGTYRMDEMPPPKAYQTFARML
jgi:hypothetical protein